MSDPVERQAVIDLVEDLETQRLKGDLDLLYAPMIKGVRALPSAQPDSKDLVEKIKNGITASDGNNEYFIGLRNGMRWCLSLIDDKEPIYESSAQPDHSGDVNGKVESAYTEGYTYAESKYRKMWDEMPTIKPERKRMSNKEWVDFLSEQFTVSRTSAREMLHGLMKWKADDNFKKQFSGRKA